MSSLFDDPPRDNDLAEGERRKREAHRHLEIHRERLVLHARRALLVHLLRQGTATIDEVRWCVPVPIGVNPVVFGSVPGPLAAKQIIRPVGSRKTTRVAGHARPVTIWAIGDESAARAWLRDHPDLDTTD